MNISKIYRKRLIPAECLFLKDDIIVEQNDEFVLTKWKTLHPKPNFSHGCSCYLIKEGIKVSKIYREDGSLVYWYCDIVDYTFGEEGEMTATDLLADVILYPDGHVEVVDLDELAEAYEKDLITKEQITRGLCNLNQLLSKIYRDKFDRLQAYLDSKGL